MIYSKVLPGKEPIKRTKQCEKMMEQFNEKEPSSVGIHPHTGLLLLGWLRNVCPESGCFEVEMYQTHHVTRGRCIR